MTTPGFIPKTLQFARTLGKDSGSHGTVRESLDSYGSCHLDGADARQDRIAASN
jgi:hypothetical protein